MKVENLVSHNGNKIPNQFRINDGKAVFFQSYDSIICKIEDGKTYLDEYYWNYSKTTSKYRSIFLGESTKETQKNIDSGKYTLINLN